MTDNQKFLTGLALGAAAGAAIAILLNSDRGKEILENVKDYASQGGQKVKDTINNLSEDVSNLWNKGKDKAEEWNQTVQNA